MLLLRDKEVIKLKEGVGFKPKLSDITDNPRKLKFIEIDAAQSPRALDDVDAAAINTNYATLAGLDPEGSDPSRRSKGTVRQSDRGPRGRQGQAVGQDAGGKLPYAGGEGIRLGQVQGCGVAELVSHDGNGEGDCAEMLHTLCREANGPGRPLKCS